MKKISILLFIIALNLFFGQPLNVLADQLPVEDESLTVSLGKPKAEEKQEAALGQFKLIFAEEAIKGATDLELIKINNWETVLPEGKKLASVVYQFDIKEKSVFNKKRPIQIEISYDNYSDDLKKIFFWDGGAQAWKELPSLSDVENKTVSANIHLPYARVAILSDVWKKESGYASWYRYKGCDCAASPDYPKKTKLRVTNLDNGKSVIVRVNDYGPERNIFPDRVIDLDVTAFKKIADKKLGVVKVKVELVGI